LLDQGVRGTVTETTTGPGGVACLVEIEWPENAPNRGPTFYQVFLVTDGLVTRIQGHDDRDLALAAISLSERRSVHHAFDPSRSGAG
jgi:hypothetical protein